MYVFSLCKSKLKYIIKVKQSIGFFLVKPHAGEKKVYKI